MNRKIYSITTAKAVFPFLMKEQFRVHVTVQYLKLNFFHDNISRAKFRSVNTTGAKKMQYKSYTKWEGRDSSMFSKNHVCYSKIFPVSDPSIMSVERLTCH